MIYVDNAATTMMDQNVIEEMTKCMTEIYGNASQSYSIGRKAKHLIQKARMMIAECINAFPEEIYFTSGGTESNNIAIRGFEKDNNGKVVITSSIEHHAILNAVETLKCNKYYLSVNNEGIISIKELEKILKENKFKKLLVSVMFANNEIGSIEPIYEIGQIVHKYNGVFHTDAVQALGHVAIDVKEYGIDIMSASAHKFNGPKGIGFIYIKKGIPISAILFGGDQEMYMRPGTENIAGIIGMALALKNNCRDLEENAKKLKNLESIMINELKSYDLDFIINGSSNHLPGLLNLSFKDADGEMLLHRMDLNDVCISTGSACDNSSTKISHVIQAIKINNLYEKGTIRLSFGKYNKVTDPYDIAYKLNTILSKKI